MSPEPPSRHFNLALRSNSCIADFRSLTLSPVLMNRLDRKKDADSIGFLNEEEP